MSGFQIEGLNRTMKEFARIRERVESDVKTEVASATVAVESGAVSRAPVGDYVGGGNLKASFGYRMTLGGLVGEVYNTAEYFIYVELGTIYMSAQPSLVPSFENVRPQFFNNLESILKKV